MSMNWPFIIIRNFGTGKENKEFIRCVFDAQRKYPGLVEEIWFAGNSLDGMEQNRKLAYENISCRKTCQDLGIQFSYQQGATLNHTADWKKREDLFSENAWAVTADGRRCYGIFCANSQEAREYTYQTAKVILETLQPESYWPDDDLRISHKGTGKDICFCDVCIAKFNQKYHHSFSREELAEKIFGENPSLVIREEWTEFNAQSLGEYAAVFRKAADDVLPSCRLGIQTVYSHWRYDGADFRPIIEALSGNEHKFVGVRPGAGYYEESSPGGIFYKGLCVGEEAARCNSYGFVGQLCYEAENWPHVSAGKTPESQMIECAWVIASGMDSLALYWGSDKNGESDENYAFYFDILSGYKPFFLSIRDAFAKTHLCGCSVYHGENALIQPEWTSKDDPTEMYLLKNSLPVVRESSESEFYVLNERAVRELSDNDLEKVFSKAVLMDIASFTKLRELFPELKFINKIKLSPYAEFPIDSDEPGQYEKFDDNRQARDCSTVIQKNTQDVQFFSSLCSIKDGAGICTVPTEFGGNIVLIQNMSGSLAWTGYRRKAILDALDSVISGGMSLRLLTGGYTVSILSRKQNCGGKTTGAFLLPASIGRVPSLELAVRNPAYRHYEMLVPEQQPVKLEIIRENEHEIVLKIPSLRGWQPALISGITE